MEISGVPLEAHITAHKRYNGKSVHVELGQTRRVVWCGVSNRADIPQSVFYPPSVDWGRFFSYERLRVVDTITNQPLHNERLRVVAAVTNYCVGCVWLRAVPRD